MPSDADLCVALEAALEEALDKMFFVAGFEKTTAGVGPGPELSAEVAFEGACRGVFSLRVTAPLARSIAADFLGEEEPSLPEERVREVVCELANMICGSALSRARGEHEFRLEAPRYRPDSEAAGGLAGNGRTLAPEHDDGAPPFEARGRAPQSGAPPDAAIALAAYGGVLEADLRLENCEWSPTATSVS